MGLFPPMLEVIPTRFRQRQARVYLYNVTRPLLLSSRASEIKKVRICIFPNAFAMLRSTMHIPHVLLLNIKLWRKVPLLSLFPT